MLTDLPTGEDASGDPIEALGHGAYQRRIALLTGAAVRPPTPPGRPPLIAAWEGRSCSPTAPS